jgi:starvation-inducible DNA-binding protein
VRKINVGIDEKERKEIVEGLSRLLADTYTLYLQTQNFHWNVTGPMFGSLHLMSEAQYLEMAEAVDGIAERIRALGMNAPATFSEFNELASIKESRGVSTPEKMIEILLEGQEAIIRLARIVYKVTSNSHDEVSSDLLVSRMRVHEKNAWMLNSFLSSK